MQTKPKRPAIEQDRCITTPMRGPRLAAGLTLALLMFVGIAPALAQGNPAAAIVNSVTTNDSKFHVFAPDQPFSFNLSYTGSGVTGYQWVDWQGHGIGPSVAVGGASFTVHSPGGEPVKPGYYGLRLLPAGTIIEPGHRLELGFAVLSKATALSSNVQPFGMNHAALDDPYLGYKWTKTTWSVPFWAWDKEASEGKLDSKGWQASEQNVLNAGRVDLPDVIGTPWGSNPPDVTGVAQMAGAFFRATPNVPAWEWGIEEAHCGWDAQTATRYYDNLVNELAAVRMAANQNGAASTKLVHQIEGVYENDPTKMPGIQAFFASSALRYVDILSLHPYPWPDYKSPDIWLDPYIKAVQKYRAASAKPNIPIWFTEVGCFTDDAGLGPNKMEDGGSPVTGLSRADAAIFTIKLHAIALTDGVSRIYWYHYQDWDASLVNAESHFGLRDYWGSPRPSYAAYANMVEHLGAKQPLGERVLPNGVRVYRFSSGHGDCYVLWAPASKTMLRCRVSLITGKQRVDAITNTVGTPISPEEGVIEIGDAPTLIETAGSAKGSANMAQKP